ncbi:hypothetical protein [Sphingomicrobium nitratireducens]|uniref:hypothetical protein n=1 Tax=Sphingomicrobium nitratireducens TaxID=2964666 RepID=UPI00223F440B|nr:hypothetical protein [Sphingomicrobium nitratireducens]
MKNQPPIPVLCDQCRAEGYAGDPLFAELAGLLDFEPVPVRRHVNNWTPAHQRAFIAALATLGNVKPAARVIGRFANGAQRLRKTPGGRGFAEAWDNALDLYDERLAAGLAGKMRELAAGHRERAAHDADVVDAISYDRRVEDANGGAGWDEPDAEDRREQLADARRVIAQRLAAARRLFLEGIADDPASRAAWETLCGRVDWDEVAAGNTPPPATASLRTPDMVVALANAEVTVDGEPDAKRQTQQVREPRALPAPDHPAVAIEQAQAAQITGERSPKDYRDCSAEELVERGFVCGPGGVWLKRL